MGRHIIRLGRILGIPVGIDYSWFLIFFLLTWTLAVGFFPAEYKNWPTVLYWIIGALTTIMLFVSVLLHELGHSIVAKLYKIPVRSITLFIFGGVSQIGAEPATSMSGFLIAVAGPVVSFLLAWLFYVLESPLMSFTPLLALVKYLFYINLALGFFNLIPGLPLDGGGVLRAILWGVTHNFRKATIIAANSGRIIAFLMILFGLFLMFRGYFLNGLWIAFIGWFLESAAMAQVQQLRVESLLAGHRVSEVMNRNYSTVAADAPLQQIVDHHILKQGQRALIVKRGDDIIGLLTLHRIKDVQSQDWPVTTAAQAVIPVDQIKLLRADTGLWKALQEMDRDGVNQLPVMEGGKILGMLSREDIISFLRSLDELGQ